MRVPVQRRPAVTRTLLALTRSNRIRIQCGTVDRDASDISAAVPADVPTDWGKSTPSPAGAGGAAPTTGGGNAPTYDPDADIVDEGAADDEEMPLADHVEEMAMRLFVVVGVMAVVAVMPCRTPTNSSTSCGTPSSMARQANAVRSRRMPMAVSSKGRTVRTCTTRSH